MTASFVPLGDNVQITIGGSPCGAALTLFGLLLGTNDTTSHDDAAMPAAACLTIGALTA